MKLSEFLDDSLGDVLVCQCGCGYGSRPEHWGDRQVVEIHRLIRLSVGLPVYVLSAARCPRHNAKVAKSERSQHSIATALDLAVPQGWLVEPFYTLCCEVVEHVTGGQGGCGKYVSDRFVHVDTGAGEKRGRRWAGA